MFANCNSKSSKLRSIQCVGEIRLFVYPQGKANDPQMDIEQTKKTFFLSLKNSYSMGKFGLKTRKNQS